MKKSNFALRLQPSLLEEVRTVAALEKVTLNQFINVAVAEKLAALRTETYFHERARRANLSGALQILDRLGDHNPPRNGDELPSPQTGNVRPVKRTTTRTSQEDTTFVQRFVIPLIIEEEEGVGILGTCALLELEEKTFLVGAAHVIKGFRENAEKIGLPAEPGGASSVEVFTLGDLDLWLPPIEREDVCDVAVAQIRNSSATKRLRSWPHLKTEFFGSAEKATEIFLMAGYPRSLSKMDENHLQSGIFYAAMPPYEKSISVLNEKIKQGEIIGGELIDPSFDLLLEYPESFVRADGAATTDFSLKGISGAPVWAVRASPLHLRPEDHLQLVGFESSVVPGEFIRAKHSELILKSCEAIARNKSF